MRPAYFLIDSDRRSHIRALEQNDAPGEFGLSALANVFDRWHAQAEVWMWPELLASLAADAVLDAASVDATTQRWFALASPHDQTALVYDARNATSLVPLPHHRVEAWLLHATMARNARDRGAPELDWPVPMLTREAWAGQRTVLQQAACLGCPAVFLRMLVNLGEDVAARDAHGATALHWVAATIDLNSDEMSHGLVAQELLDLGASHEVRDARGRTPVDIALLLHNWPAVRTLLNAGARPSSNEHWRSIEHAAARLAWPEVETWRRRKTADDLAAALPRGPAGAGRRRI